ncbi:MAG: GtrA family protein [Sulfurifustis sp.]
MKSVINSNGLPSAVVCSRASRTGIPMHVTVAGCALPIAQIFKFGIVGSFGALTYYSVLLAMVEWWRVPVLAATSIAFVLVVVETYVLHYHWTFRSDAAHSAVAPRFVFMTVTGFFLNFAIMYAGVTHARINYLLVQTCAIGVVVTWNFLVSSFWVFAGAGSSRPASAEIDDRGGDHG